MIIADIAQGKFMASEIPEIFYTFGLLNKFMSVRILLKYFRRKLLQSEWSKTMPNLGLYHWPGCVPLLLLRELHIISL